MAESLLALGTDAKLLPDVFFSSKSLASRSVSLSCLCVHPEAIPTTISKDNPIFTPPMLECLGDLSGVIPRIFLFPLSLTAHMAFRPRRAINTCLFFGEKVDFFKNKHI